MRDVLFGAALVAGAAAAGFIAGWAACEVSRYFDEKERTRLEMQA